MSRNITDLHPRLQEKVQVLAEKCKAEGLIIGIGECLRTVSEQDAIYAQGRTTPGKIVTNAKGTTYSSQHQWGIAFDFYRNDGTGAFNEEGQFFEHVGAIGKTIGLGWGGDWTSIKDRPHLYLPDWGSTATKLKTTYGTPDKFMATWGVGATETPKLTPASKTPEKENIKAAQIALNGSFGNNLTVDGIWGKNSQTAWNKALQTVLNKEYNAGLIIDGIIGTKTKAAIRNMREGDKENLLVGILQIGLYAKNYTTGGINCNFGSETLAAVIAFQKYCGLAADGIAGVNTFVALSK